MTDFVIQFPTRLNDGSSVSPDAFETLEDKLLDTFGGYTKMGTVQGAWRDPRTGTTYRDESVLYSVASDVEATHAAIAPLLRAVNPLFQQVCYAVRHSGRLDLVYP